MSDGEGCGAGEREWKTEAEVEGHCEYGPEGERHCRGSTHIMGCVKVKYVAST